MDKIDDIDKQEKENASLFVEAKGLWPLIIAAIIIAVYFVISTIMFFVSCANSGS